MKFRNFFINFISTGCFFGFIPRIGGTTGSLFGILLLLFLIIFCKISINFLLFSCIFLFILGIIFCKQYTKLTKKNDAKEFVLDEICAIFFIAYFVKLYFKSLSYLDYFLIFIIFRFFDIVKPFFINFIDKKYKNCFGVMLDDLLAAIYSIIIIFIVKIYSPI